MNELETLLIGIAIGIAGSWFYWQVRMYVIFKNMHCMMHAFKTLLGIAHKSIVQEAINRGEVKLVDRRQE